MAPKVHKASKRSVSSEPEPDRLSSLPDDILCHILSFLPTNQSVRTKILSTRWKYLFASVSVLNFYYHSLLGDASKCNKFIDFVNSIWILYNASHMEKFHFFFLDGHGQPPSHCLISSWLCSAIRRHVQEIDITIHKTSETIALPRDLLSCNTLSVLKLHGDFNLSLPNVVCLPCLKTCELEDVCLSEELAKRLFRSLPVLETLELRECYVKEDVEVLNISSPNLKRLRILCCHGDCPIELNVPNLIYFQYSGSAIDDIVGLESLKSVLDASLDYLWDPESRDDIFMDLLRAICHVRELTLSCGVIEAFVRSDQSLPTFSNLIRLTLDPISSMASKLLQDLLDNTPQLEIFTFNQWDADHNADNYSLPERVPDCVSNHLKAVKCLCFTGLDYDRELLKYFRENAKNLKDMKIESGFTYDESGRMCGPARQIDFNSEDVYEIPSPSSRRRRHP